MFGSEWKAELNGAAGGHSLLSQPGRYRGRPARPTQCRPVYSSRALLIYTGLRVSPLCSIKLGDISYAPSAIRVLVKGSKIQVVKMHGGLAELMKAYAVANTDLKGQTFLLAYYPGHHSHRRDIERMTAALARTGRCRRLHATPLPTHLRHPTAADHQAPSGTDRARSFGHLRYGALHAGDQRGGGRRNQRARLRGAGMRVHYCDRLLRHRPDRKILPVTT